jgi:hypothetical protein
LQLRKSIEVHIVIENEESARNKSRLGDVYDLLPQEDQVDDAKCTLYLDDISGYYDGGNGITNVDMKNGLCYSVLMEYRSFRKHIYLNE